jgi:hypothetical protein
MRHDSVSDSVVYETSPDGVTWQYRWEFAAPDWIENALVELQAGTLGPSSAPGVARFLSFALEPAAPTSEPEGFDDPLTANTRDESWWLITTLSTGPGVGAAVVTQGSDGLSIQPPARSKRAISRRAFPKRHRCR